MKRLLSIMQPETAALLVSIVWLLVVQFAAVLAWEAGLVTRQGALVHWLVVGVLPPALALWSMKPASGQKS
jgi:hypothetical protein